MGLIRTLLGAAVDKIAGEEKPNSNTPPVAPTDPEKQQQGPYDATNSVPPTTYNDREARRERKRQRRQSRFILILGLLTDEDFRWRYSFRSMVRWAITMIIVGIVFVCLTATGVYPASVADQKYLNLFGEGLAKYSMYIVAGILAIIAVPIARKQIVSKTSLWLPMSMVLLAMLIAIATIGMSIQILVDLNNEASVEWWSWLILALIIVQRLCFSVACGASLATMVDASRHNPECLSVFS